MRIFRIFLSLRNKSSFRKYFTYAAPVRLVNSNNHAIPTAPKLHNIGRYSTENEDDSEDNLISEIETSDQMEKTKYLLFKNPKDDVILELNDCQTLGDVCKVLDKYKHELTEEHLTQTILVLKDVQKAYCKAIDTGGNPAEHFYKHLRNSVQFNELLNNVKTKLNTFNPHLLSHLFLYLRRLGFSTEEELMMTIAEKLQNHLEREFDLSICSRWMKVIFLEDSVRPYYMSLKLIPKVIEALDTCDSVDDLSNISVCLYKFNKMITPAVLQKYVDKVEYFLSEKKLRPSDHNTILRIIRFLSAPHWRNDKVELMSRCIMLLKNHINTLDTPYLLLLYEVFFKIQEPGELLNEIQRSAAKFWQHFEETRSLDTNTALKLFSALIFFSSPLHRIELRKQVEELLKPDMDIRNLIIIRKIFSYVKISDKSLCKRYWEIWSSKLDENADITLIAKSCMNYMQFNIDIDNYRNYHFEKHVLDLIRTIARRGNVIMPNDLTVMSTFVIYYSKDGFLLNFLLGKLKGNPIQIKTNEILLLSQTFNSQSHCCTKQNFKELKNVLKASTEHILSQDDRHFEQNSVLVKAAILRHDFDNYFVDSLMMKFKEIEFMSSKLLENVSFMFTSTNTLIPEVFNKITEYVVKNTNNIVGFNAEKVLFMCFHLAYYPINADKFFRAVTDIIIRDQERLSSLAFLQSALALSFFNKLPSFLVKQIFNVEFLDRLDNELANCYSKEKYPQRVRQTLMYLNRTVCLEYPEFSVPWFHEKYVKDSQNQSTFENSMPRSIKEYLTEIVGNTFLEEKIITPYGYHIDFVVNLDRGNEIVHPNAASVSKRVALLIIKHYAFTRFYTHLRGTYQMKMKHLEIMGYSVSILKHDDWVNLLYTSERLEYLKKLIWPDCYEKMVYNRLSFEE